MTKQPKKIADTINPIDAYFDLCEKMEEATRKFKRVLLRKLAQNARDEGIPFADYLARLTAEMKEADENEAA